MDAMPEFNELKPGQIIKSKVLAVYADKVVVDLGLKSDGFIQASDFKVLPEVGSEVDVYISHLRESDGFPVISHSKAREILTWKVIEDKFKDGKIIEGKIIKKIKGGYEVDIGISSFMPSSQVSKKISENKENNTFL